MNYMRIFPLFFILGVFPTKSSVTLRSFHMSMTYFLVPDKKGSCSDDFPDGLSYFFEQIGGFDEKAEVAQVSRVLQIDLSVFQDVEYNYEDEKEVKKHWHNLPEFASIVDILIAKIKMTPDYYKKVIHDPDYQKHLEESIRIGSSGDTTQYSQWLKEVEKSNYYYPPDHGYLREGRILKDLNDLKKTLDCYQKNGVIRVRIEYM